MVACRVCQTENPDSSRFCSACGSRLTEPAALAEERKVVTALFCDLVGFTSTSEGADPEDVDRMLNRYFATARSQIEAHGGVVEKFIGDAVVGVFGVPIAHEDDAERAVRAALRITDDARELLALHGAPLRLRIGINTGETLVRLSVVPGGGERFLAGDAINTASRIQSVAPEMGVAVGEATHVATRTRFDYEELPPATLKGKAEPVRVFHAIAPRARLGIDLTRPETSRFVGRQAELLMLTSLFDASVAGRSVRFAVIVGEPGLGKSRLVAEVLAYVDAQPTLITWRQGRCLPYGTGISFWALGEIVKAHAGILESDGVADAIAKLDAVLPDTDERAWFRERLAPLVGIESAATAEREEQFTAWRRFLELMAADRPTVLVFEDLHWADEAMLAFLDELVGRGADLPLLVMATTRPELYERRAGFADGRQRTRRINLAPLSADETGQLMTGLFEATVLADDLRAPILDRAAGNPLFAEEFVRLLRDRDLLVTADGALSLRPGNVLPLPESIHALLAARLDALPTDAKAALGDASVVGKVFWAGAVAATGQRDQASVLEALEMLARREFVRRARHSSMAGEAEFAFWHVLLRDVAYAGLPRSARASRHVAAARWLEQRLADRVDDIADVLAHHYSTALDLARAVGDDGQADELEEPAFRFLSLAGERALGLDATSAISLLERALSLATPDHPQHPAALLRYGIAKVQLGSFPEAVSAFEAALAEYRERGDRAGAAEVMGRLASPLRELGDPRSEAYVREVVDLLQPLGPSRQLVEALTRLGAAEGVAGRLDSSMAALERAVTVLDATTTLREVEARGLRGNLTGWIGLTRAALGDAAGLDEVREGIAVTIATGQSERTGHLYYNLAAQVGNFDGPAAARTLFDECLEFATRRGLLGFVTFSREERLVLGFDTGDHDALLAGVPELESALLAVDAVLTLIELRGFEVQVAVLRGETPDAAILDWLESAAHRSGDSDTLAAIAVAAQARLARGETVAARVLLGELAAVAGHEAGLWWFPRLLPTIVRTAVALGDIGPSVRLLEGAKPYTPYTQHALIAARAVLSEARGDLAAAVAGYADAAARWEQMGVVPEQAFALLGQGRCTIALGRPADAAPALRRAREIFGRLRAAPALDEVNRLLDQAGATLG